ncbi:hypothetical protein BURMUCGD2M_2234 [Burkholderia multivorans CGD2M]|uniref:Uncharacterized protein n=1 Tax=Burkholderia multivorans CGD2 TaxID=513052 RepID=B9BMS4_9BURK|nr:hypothetical protein BURMUCGD2_2148 [Burkholderia multivorans CGD2]EEE14128.1 hypothetical protein BURMUCGD2M_2234 [Burkholderia multivorans CGD2M]
MHHRARPAAPGPRAALSALARRTRGIRPESPLARPARVFLS